MSNLISQMIPPDRAWHVVGDGQLLRSIEAVKLTVEIDIIGDGTGRARVFAGDEPVEVLYEVYTPEAGAA